MGRGAGETERGPGSSVKGIAGKDEGKSRREGDRGRKRKKGRGKDGKEVEQGESRGM